MKDLTEGPIAGHIVQMAVPMAVGMLIQTLYFLVDLYFVAQLGDSAIAGVSVGGTVMYIVLGLTQMLGVGTVALISHAVGRKDVDDANLVFNQSLVLSALCAALTLALGYGLGDSYLRSIGADAETTAAGLTYLHFYLPGLALQFALVAMGSALRGTGIVKPTMIVQVLTLLLNIVLAPILIAGWGTGHALGVAGAGLASSISIAIGVVMMAVYFLRMEKYVAFHGELWRPRLHTWKRMLGIGFPAGGEFALMFVFMAVIYTVIRDFGAAAQAGFGVGGRVMQSIFLPAMAIAFSTPAVAGQNFGARKPERVRETFRTAVLMSCVVMLALTLLCQWNPAWLVSRFTSERDVIDTGAQFLRIILLNFVAQGIIFTCSGMFQALGNTWPALLSTTTRLLIFAVPALWLSHQDGFRIEHVWYLSVATVTLQAALSWLLLRGQMRRRLATIT
ncbi:MATE family efflux transporter [Dokdonella immobilis]|uniref:Multidrug-efflux transporter n=1 Tax=Dokdonella immobilis TaxID=578942 RepID=A0A1I4VSW5_9GAMM|nr:MATE family efflux transporter [Dokdonella immobilis]SFN04384.1 putative efflux protein, MATE family [Dokdonella immobilis]